MSDNEDNRPTADAEFYDLRLVVTAPLERSEPTEYVNHVHGEILLEPEDDADPGDGNGAAPPGIAGHDDGDNDDDEDVDPHGTRLRMVIAGRLALTVYDLERARRDREDPFAVFDAVSHDALNLYEQLYERRHAFDLRPSIARAAAAGKPGGEPCNPSLVTVEAVELLPHFRGRGIALAAVLKALHLFGPHDGLAALVAAPLSHWPSLDGNEYSDPDDGNDERWRRRLAIDGFPPDSPAVRAKLGAYWARLGFRRVGGDLYIRGLSEPPLPRLADVLAGLPRQGGTGNDTSTR